MRWPKCASRPTTTPPSSATWRARSSAARSSPAPTSSTADGFEYWRDSSMAANTWENNRVSRREEGRAVAAHLRRDDRRPDREEQGVLLRRLPGVLPRPPGRAGAIGGAGSVAARRLLGGGCDHLRSGHETTLTGQPIDPAGRFSPIARAVLANQPLYPLPNRPGNSNNLRGTQLSKRCGPIRATPRST